MMKQILIETAGDNGLWGGSRYRQFVNYTGGQYAAKFSKMLFSAGN